MKEFFKTVKKNVIISSLLYIVLGIIIAVFPGIISQTLCYLIAGACFLYGAVCMITYFRRDISVYPSGAEFVCGAVAITAGVFLCCNAEAVRGVLSLLLSLFIIFLGIVRLQQAIDLFRLHDKGFICALVFAAAALIIGIVSACSLSAVGIVERVIGIGFLLCGVGDLIAAYRLQKAISKKIQGI